MKKLVAIGTLTLMLVMMLAACGGTSSTPVDSTSQSTPDSSAADSSVAGDASTDAGDVNTDLPDRGEWDENVYTNAFAGFTFNLPEGWTHLSDDEISSMLSLGFSMLDDSGEGFSEEMLTQNTLYEMMAVGPTNSSISLMYENLSVSPLGTLITATSYMEIVKQQIEQMYPNLSYTFDEITEQTLGSVTYARLDASEASTGVNQSYFAAKKGGYIIALVVTPAGSDTIDSLMASFS